MMKPISSKIKEYPLWSFDIETFGNKNSFLMGSIYGSGLKKTFWDKEKMLDFLCNSYNKFSSGYICATNLGFDMTALLDKTEHLKSFFPIIKNSRIISAKIKLDSFRKLRFLDTLNYAPFSVEKWGKLLNLPKLEKPPFLGERPHSAKEKGYLEKYNMQDSKITYEAMRFLQKNFNSLGAKLKITIASTAMDLFKRKYLKEAWYHPQRLLIEYLFKGYYGGRCEALKRGPIKNLNYYDFNSLYPSVMLKDFPHPNKHIYTKSLNGHTIQKYEGVCDVSVNSPDSYIPYLPLRKGKKLIFPVGKFRGSYTFFEIRKALSMGYAVNKYHSALLYTKKYSPFSDYVRELYEKRMILSAKKDNREVIYKLLLNSLYGKFAQKIGSIEHIMPEDKITYKMLQKQEKVSHIGGFFIFNRRYFRLPSFINPILSIYVTAYARDRLFEAFHGKDIYYYDTDSIITPDSFSHSEKLGELKFIGKVKTGMLIRPKFYLLGEIVKCKGANRVKKEHFYEMLSGKAYMYDKFTKFKESLRRGFSFNEKISIEKNFSLEDDKRKWEESFSSETLQDSSPLEA